MTAAGIIDGLIYLGSSHYGYGQDAAAAIAGLDSAGAEAGIAVAAHPADRDFAAANDAVAAAANDSGGRLVPLARVDPWTGDGAVAELRRAVGNGARGLFLHPSEERFPVNDAARVRPIVECAAELGVPVMISAGYHLYSEPLQLGDTASWIPSTPIVLTNGGQFNISGGSQFDAELTLGNPNVHVHTSAMYRQDFLEGVVTKFGADKLVYASAAPQFNPRYERTRADLLHVSDADRALVLGGNTARIFSL